MKRLERIRSGGWGRVSKSASAVSQRMGPARRRGLFEVRRSSVSRASRADCGLRSTPVRWTGSRRMAAHRAMRMRVSPAARADVEDAQGSVFREAETLICGAPGGSRKEGQGGTIGAGDDVDLPQRIEAAAQGVDRRGSVHEFGKRMGRGTGEEGGGGEIGAGHGFCGVGRSLPSLRRPDADGGLHRREPKKGSRIDGTPAASRLSVPTWIYLTCFRLSRPLSRCCASRVPRPEALSKPGSAA